MKTINKAHSKSFIRKRNSHLYKNNSVICLYDKRDGMMAYEFNNAYQLAEFARRDVDSIATTINLVSRGRCHEIQIGDNYYQLEVVRIK